MKFLTKIILLFYLLDFSFSQISLDKLISNTLNEIPQNSEYYFYDVDDLLENETFVFDSLKKIQTNSLENIYFILVNKLDYSNSNNDFKNLSEIFFNEFQKVFSHDYLIAILLSFEEKKINFRISKKLRTQFTENFIEKDIEKIETELKEQNIEKIMYNILKYLEKNCLNLVNADIDDIDWEDLYVIYDNEYESKYDYLEPIENQNDNLNTYDDKINNYEKKDDNIENNKKEKKERKFYYYYGIIIFIFIICILLYYICRIIELRKKLSSLYFDSKYNNIDYNNEINN